MISSFKKYTHTLNACYIGYVVQAIINNFVPLLFLTFNSSYNIRLDKIALLVSINFMVQITVDLIGAKFVDKIGYRLSAVIAHVFSTVGLVLLAFLPDIMSDPYSGILISIIIYAIGGGIIEVIISPIAEACPTKNKQSVMSLLHSFYCWGHVLVVVLSTVFFVSFGIENWKYLSLFWALVPSFNAIYFLKVPIYELDKGENGYLRIRDLLKNKLFWLMMILMITAGASEQAMSQWASAFAESGLNVSKTVGDLAGPLVFAVLMGISRVIFAKKGEKWDLNRFMIICGILCLGGYLLASLSSSAIIGFVGCALCGFSVGIMWPGTFSLASKQIRYGGTALFALLAFSGDLGCSLGPYVTGKVASVFNNDLKAGLLASIGFPILFVIFLLVDRKNKAVKLD
ncbi:MAG: MFS transporter [Clostridia bacterium]|jgi:fucose permease|nr:MFS transporter [Clostridia bacterium]MDD3971743.1 MFS transporter [Clostridia bacterium]MDD4542211.1 MFS transporter [Clostridia bacterium]NLF35833.1 MFS transporter [Clostridiaceae bacterium]